MNQLTTGRQVRLACGSGFNIGPTPSFAPYHIQANLVILHESEANDFKQFCSYNPAPLPVLEVLPPGAWSTKIAASDSDIRYDVGTYLIWKNGELLEERKEIKTLWQNDFVTFLIGCSFSFDAALIAHGIPVRHVEGRSNSPMFITDIETKPSGKFHGPLVVSMRPMRPEQVPLARSITNAYPLLHGSPIHSGDATAIGIKDIRRPDFGDEVEIRSDEIPVFWACGVTAQLALIKSTIGFAVTHKPGHMYVTDLTISDLAVSDLEIGNLK